MTGIRKLIAQPLFLTGVVALAAWWLLPGSRIERAALEAGVRGSANPPFFITEHDHGWKVRTVDARPRVDTEHAPWLVSLDDDPEGVFQTSPPSPIDLAVVFNNLRRLGAEHAACAAVLAWDAPDPIGLLALERALAEFGSVTMAAPLGRGAVAASMPPAFRRASLPLAGVRGEADQLPVVNRVPLAGAVLGGDNAWAGFQFLENEATSRFMPLLARWEDRVVFAFPLLAAIRQLDVPLDEIVIRPGESIRLGAHGPVVPIDRSGRLAVPVSPGRGFGAMPAAESIDAPDDLLSERETVFPVMRDDRSGAEPATRRFSATFPAVMAVIASDSGLAPAHSVRRVGAATSLPLLAGWCLLLAGVGRMADFQQALGFIGMAAVACTAQMAAVAMGHWLPGLPAMAALLVAVAAAHAPAVRRWFATA